LPAVRQLGQRQVEARSNLTRIFGRLVHQHGWVSVEPQLNFVPHSLQEICCIGSAPHYEEDCNHLTITHSVKHKDCPRQPLVDQNRSDFTDEAAISWLS